MTRTIPTIIIWLLMLLALPAAAHEIRPAIVDMSFDGQGQVSIAVRLNLEATMAGIGPQHADTDDAPQASLYDALRRLAPADLRARFDAYASEFLAAMRLRADGTPLTATVDDVTILPVGDLDLARDSSVRLSAPLPPDAQAVTWGWDAALGPAIVRAKSEPDGPIGYTVYLKDGADTEPIPAHGAPTQSWFDVATNYLVIGFTHIVPKGLDHILFVVGLFLLSARFAPLAWQITAFTLAHSVTLALGVLGIVRISPSVVEPLIAASIVYVAVENIISDKLQKWRPAVVFGFGLLHGLGFAGVLAEVGLAQSYFVTGLVAFNVGVELGQLFVVGLCFAAVGLWFRDKPFYRNAITIPASVAIAVVATWWFVERVGWV
ncbi:MAG: HupE/UreJ family protein [Alphaproteobacteria bacterium]